MQRPAGHWKDFGFQSEENGRDQRSLSRGTGSDLHVNTIILAAKLGIMFYGEYCENIA